MNKILYALSALFTLALCLSCSKDTQSYADLVSNEETIIDNFVAGQNINYKTIDEETMKNWTNNVLKDSIDPAELIELGTWYKVNEGDFKRLYFRINKWGQGRDKWKKWQAYQDSVSQHLQPKVRPDSVSFYTNKVVNGSYVMLRYDSLYQMTETLDIENAMPIDNLDPYSYQLIYGWNEQYYATTYYSYYYGSSSNYSCTSGGLAFPLRYLWYDSEVSLIVPFSLVPSDLSNYYYTLYYGKVKYSKPNYLPEE